MNASASEEKQRGKAQGDDVERRFPFCIKNVPMGHAADTRGVGETPSENEKEISDFRHNQIPDDVNEGKHREARRNHS